MLKKGNEAIAIIDSGIGGISILKQLLKFHPTGNYIYFADNKFMPYGKKDKAFVRNRVENIIYYLKEEYNIKEIIIACNTASSSIKDLNIPNTRILTFDKTNTYLTTALTSKNLKGYKTIPVTSLAENIEKYIFKPKKLDKVINNVVKEHKLNELNKLVLGCTHFELVADIFKKYCPNTQIELNSNNIIKEIAIKPTDELNVTIVLTKIKTSYGNKIIKLIES